MKNFKIHNSKNLDYKNLNLLIDERLFEYSQTPHPEFNNVRSIEMKGKQINLTTSDKYIFLYGSILSQIYLPEIKTPGQEIIVINNSSVDVYVYLLQNTNSLFTLGNINTNNPQKIIANGFTVSFISHGNNWFTR